MGPTILMDKSTIQGLSDPECVYIRKYYTHILSPILMREVASTFGKDKDIDVLKNKVRSLSVKISGPLYSLPNTFTMAYNNLLGTFIPMNGQIPLWGGTIIHDENGKHGIFFDESPEEMLLRKRANGNFDETDIDQGKQYHTADSEPINWNLIRCHLEQNFPALPEFKSLEEIGNWVNNYLEQLHPQHLLLQMATSIVNPEHIEQVNLRWEKEGCPTLESFVPYALYVYKVDFIYILGIISKQIKNNKQAKTHLDIQYIYYLPFCEVFTSEDKELIKLALFFKRPDQAFISRTDLKADFSNLSKYLSQLSPEERDKLSIYPPDLPDSFTCRLWGKYPKPTTEPITPEREKKILNRFRSIQNLKNRNVQL